MIAAGYKVLTQEQVNQIKKIEGNAVGSDILARLLDEALAVELGEIPDLPISKITGLQATLDDKLESPIAISDVTDLQTTLDDKLEASDITGKLDASKLVKYTSSAGSGGAATEVMTLTGILSTDTILAVSQSVAGANSLPLLGYNTLADDALTAVWSADPGAGSVIEVLVLKA